MFAGKIQSLMGLSFENSWKYWQYGDNFPELLIELERTSRRLIVYLSREMRYNNRLLFNRQLKDEFNTIYDVSDKAVAKALTDLIKNNIIKRISNGYYFINPLAAYKGPEETKKELYNEYYELDKHNQQK